MNEGANAVIVNAHPTPAAARALIDDVKTLTLVVGSLPFMYRGAVS
jgi:hypothetical protein